MSLALMHKAVAALTADDNLNAESLFKACINTGLKSPGLYSNLAVALKRQGKYHESLEYLHQALTMQRDAGTLANMCNVLRLVKRVEESIKTGHESIEIDDTSNGRTNLALAYLSAGDVDTALLHGEEALQLDPENSQALVLLYNCIFKKRGAIAAAPYLKRASLLSPNDDDIQIAIADYKGVTGRPEEALSAYLEKQKQGLLRDDQQCTMAKLLCATGRQHEAIDILRNVISCEDHDVSPHRQLVQLIDYRSDDNQWLMADLFSPSLEQRSQTTAMRRCLVGTQALVMDKLGKYDEAAKLFREKLCLQEIQSSPWDDVQRYKQTLRDEMEAYSTSLLHYRSEVKSRCAEVTDSSKFILIVGLPRCGSTLIETILALNPDCVDLGESAAMGQALAPAKQAGVITVDQMAQLGLRYADAVNAWTGGKEANYFTDKMLFNFIHLGVIDMVLPESKIIACRRNPMDQVLSIIKEDFASGNEYSANIECIAEMICLYYDTIAFYQQNLGQSRIVVYDYDQLVLNPLERIPAIIDQIGWAWDDKYLTPELSSRNVVTASVNQARQPISAKSVKGWRNYAELLAPAREIFDKNGLKY